MVMQYSEKFLISIQNARVIPTMSSLASFCRVAVPCDAIVSSSTCIVEKRKETARIGEGILLDHGTGLVIGETAVIGDRVSLMPGVTLGGSGKETGDGHPKLGEGALIGANVTVLGNIKIGKGVMIAAGSLVLNDIPPHGSRNTSQGGQEGEDVKRLNERIDSLEREPLGEKQTRGAAEEAPKHLQVAHSEADARAQEISARLAKGIAAILQPKDLAPESTQQSLLEIEQSIENLESQLADAASERSKATEMISSLQVLLAEKESKITELDAASPVEAARLRAEMKSVKGEVAHLKREHDKDKESWEAAFQALKTKVEVAESNCIRAEVELEMEASSHAQLLNARDSSCQRRDVFMTFFLFINCRDAALNTAKQQMKTIEMNLDSMNARHQKDKEAWELDLKNLEETWQNSGKDMKQELDELKSRCKRLKEEHDSFRDLADRMIEEKDNEISRLLDDNENLQRSLVSRPLQKIFRAEQNAYYTAASQKQEIPNSASSAAEQQILLLARQQAQREEELAQSQRHILALQEEIEELERKNRLHSQTAFADASPILSLRCYPRKIASVHAAKLSKAISQWRSYTSVGHVVVSGLRCISDAEMSTSLPNRCRRASNSTKRYFRISSVASLKILIVTVAKSNTRPGILLLNEQSLQSRSSCKDANA
ncbi:hypothetical protein NL676_006066 [Syzygium grande]|nr:hypothetical protein NL676_006066 [Syzygium grande]